MEMRNDGLCNPRITIRARELPGLVCTQGGVECPCIKKRRAQHILEEIRRDPTVSIRLESDADCVPHYTTIWPESYAQVNREEVFNRKRDLDVLQRLGLAPGDTRRARYLLELLFSRVSSMQGICAYDTLGWEGCPAARLGAYERVRDLGWQAVVYQRSPEEMRAFRERNEREIDQGDRIYIRSHHLMCLACGYAGGQNNASRPNDTLYEIFQRIRRQPDVAITLVEGTCQACECCDGFHPETGRCVHGGGLIRDYKKDLDCFQKLGLMPGATMKARELFDLLFERIPSTRDVCGYGDGVVTSEEWRICGGPEGCAGYEATRKTGLFKPDR